ncbi:MAG: hypothetical protein MJY64_00480 [archaeon]|nr:hypothetical protein [archaeon]
MNKEDFTPYIKQIKAASKEKISDEKLLEELEHHTTTYDMGIDAAVRFVTRKHSNIAPSDFSVVGQKKKISDLTCSENNVSITGKVMLAKSKNIIVQGSSKTIVEGSIADETGSVGFTIWDGISDIEVGAVYEFRNCYTKKFRNKPQINVGKNGSFAKMRDVEINVSPDLYAVPEVKIGNIKENFDNITTIGNISSIEKRTVIVKDKEKTVFSGVIVDDTGTIQYSAWKDFGLKKGETIRVKNAYVRSWKGILQLNFGDNCEISRESAQFGDFKITEIKEKTIAEAIKTGGTNVTIRGTIVHIKPGSGLIQRCPVCRRALRENRCSVHDSVMPGPNDYDLRLKLVIDDGTGTINANINCNNTEKITGVTLDAAKNQVNGILESEIIKKMSSQIFCKKVKVVGSIINDDYGSTIIVKDISFESSDISNDAKHLLKTVEDYQ